MKSQAENLIQRFRDSQSSDEKETLAAEYRAMYPTLSEEEKKTAKAALQPVFDGLRLQFEQTDEIIERLEKWKQPSV